MSFQAYIDNIKTKTGLTPDDFKALAEKKGLLKPGTKTGQIVSWLKNDFSLGHGHAMAIVVTLKSATEPQLTVNQQIAKHFSANKALWRKPYDELIEKVSKFGPDVSTFAGDSYISLLRGGKKFAIVQITAKHLDIGIKLRGEKPTAKFKLAGSWNAMVSHRLRITKPEQIDKEVIGWLKRAYERT